MRSAARARRASSMRSCGASSASARRSSRRRTRTSLRGSRTRAWMLDAFARDWPDRWESIAAAGNSRAADVVARQCAPRHARCVSCAPRRGRVGRRGLRHSRPRRCGSRRRWTSMRCPALRTAKFPCRTPPRSSRRASWRAAPGMRVLDACAAPGGKTCHLAELEPGLAELVALDVDAERATRIESNLARLGLAARVVVADAAQPASLVGRPAIRADTARRALLGHRRDPPPSRHQAAAPRRTISRALRRSRLRCCAPAGACSRRAAGSSTRAARCFAAENAAVVGAFLAGEPPGGRVDRIC